jgi:hypothetical protein
MDRLITFERGHDTDELSYGRAIVSMDFQARPAIDFSALVKRYRCP